MCSHQKRVETAKYVQNFSFQFCADVNEKYTKLCKIGQGTFGEVYKAKDKSNNNVVALKKMLNVDVETEGFPITAVREIKILQRIKHSNLVQLIEICGSKPVKANNFVSGVYLVFEFCDFDLAGVIASSNISLALAHKKDVVKQLLEGLCYIHQQKVMHRDMKTANVLITKKGKV